MKQKQPKGTYVRTVCVDLPTEFGSFKLYSYENVDNYVHLAIVKGDIAYQEDVPLRIHSSCVTGDILGSKRCDCREQLIKAMEYIENKGSGIVIYAFQEGRGIGLINKLRAYYLQENGLDTLEANLALGLPSDMRKYDFVKSILDDQKIYSVSLITNNPNKIEQLKSLEIQVNSVIPHEMNPCSTNREYLRAKKERMGHLLNSV